MFHNILVAVDGSAHADRALTEAIDLAHAANARMTIITAVGEPRGGTTIASASGAAAALGPALFEDAERVLRAAADRVPDDISVTTILTEQPIRQEILKRIETGPSRHRDHGLARARDGPVGRARQRQPPHPPPQSGARPDRPRGRGPEAAERGPR